MLNLVRAPTLVIAGQYDRVTLPAASRALAEALPDARYVEIRRAAHAPFLSHTSEFAALVSAFLRGESATGPNVDSAASANATSAVSNAGAAGTAHTPSTAATASAPDTAKTAVAMSPGKRRS
jgi:hypothetical protein